MELVGGQSTKMQIRIYCECIEQGQEFFLPIFEVAFPTANVKLARIPRVNKVKNNRGLKGVFDLANPDGLATIVEGGQEYPFATFEISDAVKTEDHEFQRFPQVCSAMSYDLVYIKISPHNKKTRVGFGGNTDFNPLVIPTTLRDHYNFRGAYILDWPNGSNDFVCNRNPDYPSCPATGCVKMLQPIIHAIAATLGKGVRPNEGTYEFSDAVWSNLENTTKTKYTSILDNAPSQADLFKKWAGMTPPSGKGYLRKKMASNDELIVTIPRFEKDSPGPGEVMGYAMISKAKTVGIAYCGRDRGMRIDSKSDSRKLNHPCSSRAAVMYRFFDIFAKKKDKMPKELLELLKTSWYKQKAAQIDITAGLTALAKKGKMKKWVLTMVFFADYLKVHDRPGINHPVTFHWSREKIIGSSQYSKSNPMDNLRSFNLVVAKPPISLNVPTHQISQVGKEDYVTWAATQILKAFGWNFIALSYPGSQGDGAILPSGSSGLKRERTYCDGLGRKKKCGLLLEAKHKESQIVPDVTKLNKLVAHEDVAIKDAFSRMGKKVEAFTTCAAFSVPDGGLAKSNARRAKLSGIELAVTFSDFSGKYQVVKVKGGKILKEGPLPTHQMHSIA